MGNLEGRLERLERLERLQRRPMSSILIEIYMKPGETEAEAWARHLAQHPGFEKAEWGSETPRIKLFLHTDKEPLPTGEDSSQPSPGSEGKSPANHSPKIRMIK